MVLQTTLLVLCFVAACLSSAPLNLERKGQIKYEETFNFTIPATNLQDVAHFQIHSTVAFVVCIQEKYNTPAGSQFSNSTCTQFYNRTAGESDFDFELRNEDYEVGVYFASSVVTPENVTNVTATVKGETCDPHQYYDSDVSHSCTLSQPLNVGNNNVIVKEGVYHTQFFEYVAPELLGHLIVTVVKTEGEGAATEPIVRLRYNAAPSALEHDADNLLGPAKIVTPRPGVWVVGFEPEQQPGTYVISLAIENCEDTGMAGEGCRTPYQPAESNMTLVAFPNEFRYFRFVVTPSVDLNVSLTTLKHTDLPHLYLLQGNIPTKENAIIHNCNQGYCNVVNSVRLSSTSDHPEVWFIGVTASVTEGNTSYGIWFNSSCAPDCETDNHGSCEDDGTCTCQMDFTGVDCATRDGIGAQIIVLIIIAALIVASAVIGFVAWAYMRRKRVNYELVS